MAASATGTVYRIRGIPLGMTVEEVTKAIDAEFATADDDPKVEIRAIVEKLSPSCENAQEQTALLEFDPVSPAKLVNDLQRPDVDYYPVDISSDVSLDIDKDFYPGLTQLYPTACEKSAIKADIVAVSGLNGHAYGSWSKTNAKGKRLMWLRHFLSKDLPDCRIMTYGYNAELKCRQDATIPDLTDEFLEELKKVRRSEEEKKRPIIFIGHSFGGILISQALVKAKEKSRADQCGTLFSTTAGVVFFGVPHRGMIVRDILQVLDEGNPRAELVDSISQRSNVLQNELRRFVDYCTSFKIVSFKELRQAQMLTRDPVTGIWSRAGGFYKPIGKDEAILQLPDTIEKAHSVDADHSTMVKFSTKRDATYTTLLDDLKGILKTAGSPKAENPGTAPAADAPPPYLSPAPPVPKDCPPRSANAFDAIRNRRLADLQWFLEHQKVDLNEVYNNKTLLQHALSNGDEASASLLLRHNADPNVYDSDGFNALHLAVKHGLSQLVEQILASGKVSARSIAADEHKSTPLHLAVMHSHLDIARQLLAQDPGSISARNVHGATPLHCCGDASVQGAEKLIELLVKNGADVQAPNNYGTTVLHRAARFSTVGVVSALLRYHAYVNAVNKDRNTPLHFAALNARERSELEGIVEALVQGGADRTARNSDGKTPLEFAREHGNATVVQRLERNYGNRVTVSITSDSWQTVSCPDVR